MFDRDRWKALQVQMYVLPIDDPFADQLAQRFFDELVEPNLESPELGEILSANDGPHFGSIMEKVLDKSAKYVNSGLLVRKSTTALKCVDLDTFTRTHLRFLSIGLRDGRTPPNDIVCYSIMDDGNIQVIPKVNLENSGHKNNLPIFEERTPEQWFQDNGLSKGNGDDYDANRVETISSRFWRIHGGYAKYLQAIIKENRRRP